MRDRDGKKERAGRIYKKKKGNRGTKARERDREVEREADDTAAGHDSLNKN